MLLLKGLENYEPPSLTIHNNKKHRSISFVEYILIHDLLISRTLIDYGV